MSGCRDYNSKVSLSPPRLATPPPKEHYIAHFAAVPIASCIRRASRSHRLLGRGGGGGGGGGEGTLLEPINGLPTRSHGVQISTDMLQPGSLKQAGLTMTMIRSLLDESAMSMIPNEDHLIYVQSLKYQRLLAGAELNSRDTCATPAFRR